MWYIILVVVTVTRCAHVARNDSSVLVTYAGHAEAVPVPVPSTGKSGTDKTGTSTGETVVMSDTDSDYLEHSNVKNEPTATEPSEGVVFIPSGNQDGGEYARRSNRERERESEVFRVKDVMDKHTIGDIINDRIVPAGTESPNEGILFISGKNNENMEQSVKKEEEDKRIFKEAAAEPVPLDCSHLNCEHTLASVCGVRLEQKRPKYRLFLNECFFRKVNCGFSYEYNRYATAPLEKCATVGSHYSRRPEPPLRPRPPPPPQNRRRWDEEQPPKDSGETRRVMPSRRALSTGVDGAPCSHPCPSHCPDDYMPECAITITATLSQRARVFLNHCQLDLHSCTSGTVWQRRPLSDCVGSKKAEVQNNRAFIGWMQRVGIVDSKGRMVLA